MRTYFIRHTQVLAISDELRDRLWQEQLVAIHFPEDSTDKLSTQDNESLNPADYPPNAAQNIRALVELAQNGGYIMAEYHGMDEILVGRVAPGTEIRLIRGLWRNADGYWGEHGRVAVLKALPLQDVRVMLPASIAGLWEDRPPRGTLRRWPRAGDRVAHLLGDTSLSDASPNHWQRAYFAWDELADYARNHRTVFYDTLGGLIGIHHRAVKYPLALIQDYCLDNKLPPLTILVVNKHTGLPGEGFIAWNADNLDEGGRQVYAFDWAAHGNPFSFAAGGADKDEIVTRIITDPERAEEVYAVTKTRGAAQMLFRSALFRAYDGVCAFSGSTLEVCLEAAHLVPWRDATHRERLDVRNGILLTSWHHHLFDAGLLWLDEEFRVHLSPSLFGARSSFDRTALADLNGKRMYLPRNPGHRPDAALIRKRNTIVPPR